MNLLKGNSLHWRLNEEIAKAGISVVVLLSLDNTLSFIYVSFIEYKCE